MIFTVVILQSKTTNEVTITIHITYCCLVPSGQTWELYRDEPRYCPHLPPHGHHCRRLVGLVSLAIGAHAALNKRSLDAAKAIATEHTGSIGQTASRVALVIGNGHYPDASAPLAQPINDARGLTAALRGKGFDVDVVEDATRDDMARAIARLKDKIKPDSVVMLFFGGYGVQVGRESFMIPVDARSGRKPMSAATASASSRCWTR